MKQENDLMYQMIADEKELEWFFKNVVQKPKVNESYSMVFVSRHKKLTKEEQQTFGLTRKESEFLATQSVRLNKFKDALWIEEDNWSFNKFLKLVKRFNVDKTSYTTGLGLPLPDKTLAVIFYVNPCDDIKVADTIIEKINKVKTAIVKGHLIGKTTVDDLQSYQMFGNLESSIKHLKAVCKGSKYWIDFDIDLPEWFKQDVSCVNSLKEIFNTFNGKGNYVMVQTSGGYHVLCRVAHVKSNPYTVCKEVEKLYENETKVHNEVPYEKFECILNDSQIPGLPLPGTYQYGNPVKIINKEDFIKV